MTAPPIPAGFADRRRLYGRHRGRRLSASQQRLVEELLPRLRLGPDTPELRHPKRLFPRAVREVWLEAGFGAGEHLAWQATRHPEVGLIGAEPFLNGIAALLAALERERLDNVRIHQGDVRDLLDALAPASLARVFVLFPDPWPKKRHWKRRLLTRATLARLAAVMVPGGELRFASDDLEFVAWTLDEIRAEGSFESLSEEDQRPADWPATRYEQKARAAARSCMYLRFTVRRYAG